MYVFLEDQINSILPRVPVFRCDREKNGRSMSFWCPYCCKEHQYKIKMAPNIFDLVESKCKFGYLKGTSYYVWYGYTEEENKIIFGE